MSNGINNLSGIFLAATGPVYLALAPVAAAITKPESTVQNLIETVVDYTVGSDVASSRAIPALAVIYAFWTFAGSSSLSIAGQAMSRPQGFDNDHPRKHRGKMEGLPLRLMSAHHSLIENFSLFATGACLAQVLAPTDQQILNLLGLHVLLKVFVFYPSYVVGFAPTRSLSHLLSISAIIMVFWLLAKS
ncbi:hypothetical protein N7491_000461 [Penicillium cf. griseofulvum]|uniref:MAPEG family protein n=1 Tax=Penicillium cf. griseofulvum TaxID=2972120 RepID=A0A9W9JL60_9EURO|nr:hypothetical protein N7472_004177 [Penicillium cf. griseofulvum]KAJ5443267.1 hypothetical protein N7445_004380 [Penicillium cf. griseofulvum]KAJ5451279.1 hypothetical protein N7491_000461 [Penicillium cf. griseofulvum]